MSKSIILSIVVCAVVLTGAGFSTPTAMAIDKKAELIEAMASHAGLSKADSKKALDGFLNEFMNEASDALKKGDRLSLVGFGSFSVSKRATTSDVAATVEFFPDVRSTGAANRHPGKTVTSADLAKQLAEKCRADADKVRECPEYDRLVKSLIAVTVAALETGEAVEWDMGDSERSAGPSFGTFTTAIASSISKRSARTGRNPQTGKEIKIPVKNTVKFKAGAELSKAVN